LGELIAEFRTRTGDNIPPAYLFPDAQVTVFANQAETEAAIRAKLLYDTKNKTVVSGTSLYTLDSFIFKINSAVLTDVGGKKHTLTLIDRQTLDKVHPLWREDSDARPKYLITDESKYEFYPTPDAAYTLKLDYHRTPLDVMRGTSDEPEINPRHHDGLVDWMVRQALLVKDIDTESLTLSPDAESKFIRRFGIRESANVMRKQARRGAHTTRPIRF
jgi:hypothetical protein